MVYMHRNIEFEKCLRRPRPRPDPRTAGRRDQKTGGPASNRPEEVTRLDTESHEAAAFPRIGARPRMNRMGQSNPSSLKLRRASGFEFETGTYPAKPGGCIAAAGKGRDPRLGGCKTAWRINDSCGPNGPRSKFFGDSNPNSSQIKCKQYYIIS